jgi:hypothetical protein
LALKWWQVKYHAGNKSFQRNYFVSWLLQATIVVTVRYWRQGWISYKLEDSKQHFTWGKFIYPFFYPVSTLHNNLLDKISPTPWNQIKDINPIPGSQKAH